MWAKQQNYAFCVDLLEVKGSAPPANPELELPAIACQSVSRSLILFTAPGELDCKYPHTLCGADLVSLFEESHCLHVLTWLLW